MRRKKKNEGDERTPIRSPIDMPMVILTEDDMDLPSGAFAPRNSISWDHGERLRKKRRLSE